MKVLTSFLFFILSMPLFAQEHSLLYEVSGNGLKKPSYLFGTFHLMTSSFIDSQKVVMKKLRKSKAVAGEISMDSLGVANSNYFLKLKSDTPLSKLLSTNSYIELNAWMFDVSGSDLTFFDRMPPAFINAFLAQRLFMNNFPLSKDDVLMDMYFQSYAHKHRKKVIGLERVQTQIDALFSPPLKRQAEQLEKFVSEKDSAVTDIIELMHLYRTADYDNLRRMMYDEDFSPAEIKSLLTDRNNAWMQLLPQIMSNQSTFIAVGAMHLAGSDGLVDQLKSKGYKVTPLPLR